MKLTKLTLFHRKLTAYYLTYYFIFICTLGLLYVYILLHFINGLINGSQIGSHMRTIKWRCFRWPWMTPNPPNHPNLCIFRRLSYLHWVDVETSYLVYRLIIASPSRRMTNRPWKGRGYVTWQVLNFGCPIHISGMAEARALKFLPRDAMLSAVYAVVVCLSICVCVCVSGVCHTPVWYQKC